MRSENVEQNMNECNINQDRESNQIVQENLNNEDFTFSRSTIKTTRSNLKLNSNTFIKSQIIKKENSLLEKNLNYSETINNHFNRFIQVDSNKCLITSDDDKKSYNLTVNENINDIKQNNPPKLNHSEKKEGSEYVDEDNNIDIDNSSFKKKKKDWKSWSSQEKELFYEAIANGGNYSSLQKLFKNMNNKIGTKSTEKIRDYYYRALKNVNKLLRSVGDSGINRKNRDEVLMALNCYGKMITSSNSKKKSKLDAMKKLNRHPRLFKKTALSLKKFIMRGVKSMRTRNLVGSSSLNSCRNKAKQISKNISIKRENKINNYSVSNIYPNIKIIDPDGRKIPFEKFTLRLTPYDQETYFKMIESNYSSRFEISIPYNKSLKQLIEILSEKWKNVFKKYKNTSLYLTPIEDIWIQREVIFFSAHDNTLAYDIGDIYAGYGFPSTSVILMQYQWNDLLTRQTAKKIELEIHHGHGHEIRNTNSYDCNSSNNIINNSNMNQDNSLLVQPTLKDESPILKVEDLLNYNESDDDKEKSFIPLEQEYDEFDPLEFLGIYKTKNKQEINNSSDLDDEFDFGLDEKNCKLWDEDEDEDMVVKDFKNISPKNSKVVETNNTVKPNDNNNDENDPYKRLDFFSKIRNKDENNTNLTLANEINNFNKSVVFTISECNSNVEGDSSRSQRSNLNSKGYLNFQDLNSKIKQNDTEILNTNTNVSSSLKRPISFNISKPTKVDMDSTLKKTNEISNIQQNIINNDSNIIETSNNPSNKKRIPFKNNNTMIKTKNNLTQSKQIENNSRTGSQVLTSIENIIAPQSNNVNHSESPLKSQNYFTPFLNSNSINKKSNDNKLLLVSSFERKDETNNYNYENSNILNFSSDNIGMFGESNMNLIRHNNNTSSLFADNINNMFNSSHLNSIFAKNMIEDTMMKKINNNLDDKEIKRIKVNDYDVNDFKNKNLNLNSIEKDPLIFNNKIENKANLSNVNLSTSNPNDILEKGKILNKKTNRKKNSDKNNQPTKIKRTNPVNLDEMLSDNYSKINKKKNLKNLTRNVNNHLIGQIKKNPNQTQTQKINISNTNPYIINQNNYFNGFNSGAHPNIGNYPPKIVKPHDGAGFYPPQNPSHPFQMDIPHPNNFIESRSGSDLNYQCNAGRPNDYAYYPWSNYPMHINPISRIPIGYYQNKPGMSDFYNHINMKTPGALTANNQHQQQEINRKK